VTGLSFELTAEQEQLRQMVRDFADRECPGVGGGHPARYGR
jgi:hypothetical protein